MCVFCSISVEPSVKNQGLNYRGVVKGRISLSCVADGIPLPDIVWLRDGCPLSSGIRSSRLKITETVVGGFRRHVPEAMQSDLTIHDSAVKDGGIYTCRATNSLSRAYMSTPHQVTVDGE